MDIFAFNKANIDFIHQPTLDTCMARIHPQPFWIVLDRICYHVHETPMYIIYRNRPVPYEYVHWFDSYLHIRNLQKPLFSISMYSHAELSSMALALHQPIGTKSVMYAKLKAEIGANESVVKKLIQH